jgi:DNA-directed RNA polymerase subunit RPC12/RpoP
MSDPRPEPDLLESPNPADVTRFPCAQCGAQLAFMPGTEALQCEHCGHDNLIERDAVAIRELDYEAKLRELARQEPAASIESVKCDACGVTLDKPDTLTAFECPYCGSNIVTEEDATAHIQPRSLLPFHIDRNAALDAWRNWIKRLWFAPNALKKRARTEGKLSGVYVPYWTYDCRTTTDYTGMRGEHYWVTESYTTTVNGKTVTKTRRVRKTRWYPASGRVFNTFDDLLILASRSLPKKYADRLKPWHLEQLLPYRDEYLAGFRAERYQVSLDDGFTEACALMVPDIRVTIRGDIGGDEQRITSMDVEHDDITFKHILLPIWISAYRYKKRVYRVLINARTGEVQGERPWSVWKILLAVLGGIAAVGGVFLFMQLR